MNETVYSVIEDARGWTVEVDGAPILCVQSREQAVALAQEAARLLREPKPPRRERRKTLV